MDESESSDEEERLYESLESGREKLSRLRDDVKNLLENWDKDEMLYRQKESIFNPHLHFLFFVNDERIHSDKTDVTADVNILEALKTKLEGDIAETENQYLEIELLVLSARKKLSMMLQKLDSLIPENDFRKFIEENIGNGIKKKLGNRVLERYLEVVDTHPQYLPKEFADRLNSVSLVDVKIDVDNPEDIRSQLLTCLEEENNAYERPIGEKYNFSTARYICRIIERVLCTLRLRVRCLEIDSKEERADNVQPTIQAADGVQPAIQADDGVKLAKPVNKG